MLKPFTIETTETAAELSSQILVRILHTIDNLNVLKLAQNYEITKRIKANQKSHSNLRARQRENQKWWRDVYNMSNRNKCKVFSQDGMQFETYIDHLRKQALQSLEVKCRRRLSRRPGRSFIADDEECKESTPIGDFVAADDTPLALPAPPKPTWDAVGSGASTSTGILGVVTLSLSVTLGWVIWKGSKLIRRRPRGGRTAGSDLRDIEETHGDTPQPTNGTVNAQFSHKKVTSSGAKKTGPKDDTNGN
eukprot:GHVT01059240.1.p1 GENE.GHVT01059240.1~~GHVT01059240.1.p1  ORF type:complete len:249 (-),score=14.24 GHVT01059240.1:1503-2249(-)